MSTILSVEALASGYGQFQVLDGLELSVAAGHVVAVVGPNGAGKSTLLKTLSGVADQTSGAIRFDGDDISKLAAHERTRRGLLHVPEGRHLFPDLTVEQNLKVASAFKRVRAKRSDNLAWVREVFPGLARRWNVPAGSLSGGEQQMVAIGRALMGEPRVLMVDEPSLGLAPKVVEEIYERLVALTTQGLALLIVEQNVTHSFAVADYGYVLERGRVALEGPAVELAADHRVAGIYLGGEHV
ncbi:ABC transporter ATP-binding protein [Nocardioides sp. GXZ039]|uniref:ABC transporter ATP-binding protein n=1 Tax=Nocardioides sp. GXZ039 TaxID=3136018 RepID=UPI0030F43ECF